MPRYNAKRRPVAGATLLAIVVMLVLTAPTAVHAGTYVINNCPSAPVSNGNPGPWTIFGSPQADKGSCSAGVGDFVGPRGGSMSPNSSAGVQITAPADITIREAKIWWAVPRQESGADDFAIALANGSSVGGGTVPLSKTTTPEILSLPSSTTTLTLENYCSSDDGAQGCVFGGGENNLLQLFGAQLTLADSRLPTGKVTGGGLSNPASQLSGTQSLAYEASEPDTGVHRMKLLIDGSTVTTDEAECTYEDFAACQTSVANAIIWNTASVIDGSHSVQAIVESASQNSSTFYDNTITTHNAPINNTLPHIVISSRVAVGETLSSHPGSWMAPNGAGAITYTYQWEDCSASGSECVAITGATNATYTPAPSDVSHALRLQIIAADNDGYTTAVSPLTGVVLSSQGSLGAPNGPGTDGGMSQGPNGGGVSVAVLGTANGIVASDDAQLRLGVPYTISRAFAKRSFRLAGHLMSGQGQPIAGATLDILEQALGSAQQRLIAHSRTRADGTFALTVPGGPSRLITVAYRAFAGQTTYAAQARVLERVGAGVRLRISPRTTGSTGTIVLTGQALGAIPKHGVLVELRIYYRGEWVVLGTPRTDRKGRFHFAYPFHGAVGRFRVKAEIPSGQAGYAYSYGHSQQIDVTTH